MVKQVTYKDPFSEVEYFGEVIIDTNGVTIQKRVSDPSNEDDVWRRYWQVDGFINGQNVYSKTCSDKEELIGLAEDAEGAVYKALEIKAIQEKKETVENKLLNLGYTNQIQ